MAPPKPPFPFSPFYLVPHKPPFPPLRGTSQKHISSSTGPLPTALFHPLHGTTPSRHWGPVGTPLRGIRGVNWPLPAMILPLSWRWVQDIQHAAGDYVLCVQDTQHGWSIGGGCLCTGDGSSRRGVDRARDEYDSGLWYSVKIVCPGGPPAPRIFLRRDYPPMNGWGLLNNYLRSNNSEWTLYNILILNGGGRTMATPISAPQLPV